jgi:hypothetical protein
MSKYDKLELARWVVKKGKQAGANDLAVDVINDRSISVDLRILPKLSISFHICRQQVYQSYDLRS